VEFAICIGFRRFIFIWIWIDIGMRDTKRTAKHAPLWKSSTWKDQLEENPIENVDLNACQVANTQHKRTIFSRFFPFGLSIATAIYCWFQRTHHGRLCRKLGMDSYFSHHHLFPTSHLAIIISGGGGVSVGHTLTKS
jgi:hypothetical protein